MRRRRIFLTALAVVVGLVMLQEPATADCAGPTLSYEPIEGGPGDVVAVEGQWFGDNCYDTGPPPEGEGDLGVPIAGIDIVVVQGEREWIVAQGAAGPDYGFTVDIVLPDALTEGEAAIVARWGAGFDAYPGTREPILIVDTTPTQVPTEPVTFGPVEGEPDTEAPEPDAPDAIEETAPVDDPDAETIGPAEEPTLSAQDAAELAAAEDPPEGVPANGNNNGDTDNDDNSSGPWLALGIAVVAVAVAGLVIVSKR